MPPHRTQIFFTGNESQKEMSQKMIDITRQYDNRISRLENEVTSLKKRVSELEN